MDPRIADLLELEPLEANLFGGASGDTGSPQAFAGQVLGQALMAASRTVDGVTGVGERAWVAGAVG